MQYVSDRSKGCPDEPMQQKQRPLQAPVDAHTMAGKVICGYQGWFGTPSDPSGEERWRHWGGGRPHSLDRISYELYPDIREYPSEIMHPTGFAPHGNGQQSALFSSTEATTVDTHFRWMAEYGIDGVALQRFFGDIPSPRMRQVMQNVRQAAEKYGRAFYICYDISGGGGDEFVSRMCEDIDRLSDWVLDSPAYLHEGDRPVLQLWGFGVRGNCRCLPEQALEVVEYARQKGFYLIAGTPAQFRESGPDSLPEFAHVYDHFDMISPWQVGRFARPHQVAPYYEGLLKKDGEYCDAKGQAYMPVLFAGFAWSLWLRGPANEIPRLGGRFFWEQAKAAAKIKSTALYIAMFDEYDESTAIMKAAEDSSQIPQGRYFLTTCADGVFVSGDFYLRLAGKLTSLYRDGQDLPEEVPVALTEGPVYLRTGFEEQTDVKTSITVSVEGGATVETGVIRTKDAHVGASALQVKIAPTQPSTDILIGILNTGSYTISPTMMLRAYVKCMTPAAANMTWDLQTADGTWLSEVAPDLPVQKENADQAGWQKIMIPVGQALGGKTMQRIALRYNGSDEVHLLADDVLLYES